MSKDTFFTELPREHNGEISTVYTQKHLIEIPLELKDLSKGFDSLFIRISYSFVESDSSQKVEIFYDKQNKQRKATIYNLLINYSPGFDSIIGVNKEVLDVKPKSGWQTLITRLNASDIQTLPDFEKIEKYEVPMDGSGVVVEIATRNSYRMYTYISPGLNKQFIAPAKKMCEILKIIEDELGFQQLGDL